MALENYASRDAIVTYACPAFYQAADLFAHAGRRSIIQQTNFVQPSQLRGHHSYTFILPGTHGRACSKIKETYGKDFKAMRSENLDRPLIPASVLIKSAGASIKKVFLSNPRRLIWDKRLAVAHEIVKKLSHGHPIEEEARPDLSESIYYITALRFAFGTSLNLMVE